MSLKIILAVLAEFIVFIGSEKVQNLGGQWLLNEAEKKYVNLAAKVPGGIYTDLMNNGIIGDVFSGYNDNTTRWVPRSDWIYHRNFTVDDDLLNFENINIVFEGLDTFATVVINDVKVGESQNMFAQYIFNIKTQLRSGFNKIEVRFQSPIKAGENLFNEQSKSYDIPPDCVPEVYRGECHINMLRKMQASYSWDWGPSFPSVGIWKDLFIEAYNGSAIRYVVTDTIENGTSWVLNIDTYFANNVRAAVVGTAMFVLTLPDRNLTSLLQVSQTPNEYKEIVLSTSIEIPKSEINTWWPNGYGKHDLYNLTVIFSNEDEREVSIKHSRIGFRTIELIEDTIASGLTFYFKVNGVPIFMKGSNEVPIDILPEKGQNKSTIKKLLTDVHDTNMNMLRVWGGGVYESDYFYDLADELGILIWQDFAFASAMYPANDNYLNNVLDEVRHQVKRIISHAGLALFAGNNENEGNLVNNYFHTNDNKTTFIKDYVKLYVDTIKKEFERLTHKRALFVISSPTNGKKTIKEGYIGDNPGNPFYGDVHFYSDRDPFNAEMFPIPRFCSEYGAQALPSIATLLTATNNTSDLNINGAFMDHRQHKKGGNSEMKKLIDYQLSLPDEKSKNYYNVFIYYTQIMQAMWTRLASEHFRRYRSNVDDKGQGYTMGALYWMLNDVWVAPTWAGIDYTGKWKMLQYHTAEFFAPIIITGNIGLKKDQKTLEIYIVSDSMLPVSNATATIRIYKWNSFDAVSTLKVIVNLHAGKSHLIKSFNSDDYFNKNGCGSDRNFNCFVYLSLNKDGKKLSPDNFVLPGAIKNCKLQVPKVKIESIKKHSFDEEIYEIEVTTDQITLFVWLDTFKIKGRFSENGFLQVTRTRTLYFYSDERTTVNDLFRDITVTNLLDK